MMNDDINIKFSCLEGCNIHHKIEDNEENEENEENIKRSSLEGCTIHHNNEEFLKNKYNEFKNLTICLIDIVGFSVWCSKHNAKTVIDSMIQYNNTINQLLTNHPNLYKIELVGDSCLIVGRMFPTNTNTNTNTSTNTNTCDAYAMVVFCLSLLESEIGKTIFNSETITIRMGIHIGDVFGTFMTYPTKFQLYGNDINTTSRLESSSIPGVIHVSDRVLFQFNAFPNIPNLEYGNIVSKILKGVGEIQCAYLNIKREKYILVADDLKICQVVVSHLLKKCSKKYSVKIHSVLNTTINRLKSEIYKTVILDINSEHYNILDDFQNFRIWETTHRSSVQHVIAYTAFKDITLEYHVLFNNIIYKDNTKDLVCIVDKL